MSAAQAAIGAAQAAIGAAQAAQRAATPPPVPAGLLRPVAETRLTGVVGRLRGGAGFGSALLDAGLRTGL